MYIVYILLIVFLLPRSNLAIVSNTIRYGGRALEGLGSIGISSILKSAGQGNQVTFLLGCKNGEIREIYLGTEKDLGSFETLATYLEDPSTTPSPVFALAADTRPELFFSGDGSRFVSVWDKALGEIYQKLGPHTGWVKSLIFESATDLLHCIGCNCIETYSRVDGRWEHTSKTSIDSSPELASSLSSDLLCLESLDDAQLVFAGGVDGRIHLWKSSAQLSSPIHSLVAHQGRVNTIAHCTDTGLLATGSHDSFVKLWTVQDEHIVQHSELQLKRGDRVTCVAWVKSKWLVAGTNNGEIYFLEIKDQPIIRGTHRLKASSKVVTNALCVFCTDNSQRAYILVGHSKGAEIISIGFE